MRILYDFLSLKNDVNVPSKSNNDVLKVTDENSRIRIRISIRIRIRIRIHWSEVWICGSGPVPKIRGSATLLQSMCHYRNGSATQGETVPVVTYFVKVWYGTRTSENTVRKNFCMQKNPFDLKQNLQRNFTTVHSTTYCEYCLSGTGTLLVPVPILF